MQKGRKKLKKVLDKAKGVWYNNKAVRESGERDRSLKIEQQEIKKYKAKKHSAKESRNSEKE